MKNAEVKASRNFVTINQLFLVCFARFHIYILRHTALHTKRKRLWTTERLSESKKKGHAHKKQEQTIFHILLFIFLLMLFFFSLHICRLCSTCCINVSIYISLQKGEKSRKPEKVNIIYRLADCTCSSFTYKITFWPSSQWISAIFFYPLFILLSQPKIIITTYGLIVIWFVCKSSVSCDLMLVAKLPVPLFFIFMLIVCAWLKCLSRHDD